ncbi:MULTISPECIES: SDR family oxidoreductase [unclassified Rhodococcus (in: high G+C Gram-positive bacteria)]|uniref:SDR family oxidoreductase n=1 Tax=unclassified Rhodococcus (in: high G+C Gram-positive bacteria) TaxID=192944 RepID=UPI00163AF33B|nr:MULTISPECIES: SDR family oxidoreductase [unclassified Rhodococcus (in: high G+C Gram-positive bacteria)]MBC2637707.1 SDR family oxidoreductase [Rhodococcus sp. 3A]MBC2897549.1 SDR family oxidoreductase [Rhodococcus sp. 4CII]
MNATTETGLFDVSGARVLVTGGTGGIGLMIARGFVRAGAEVIVSSRKADSVRAAQEDLGSEGIATGIVGDVSTPDSARALAAEVLAQSPKIDVLVNNAGTTWGSPMEEFPDSAWDRVMHTNVEGVFHLTVALLPGLRQAASQSGRAGIINIGSTDGINVPEMDSFSYGASKAAVHHLTRHLAKKLAPESITVNAIAPGPFESKMTRFVLDDPAANAAVTASIPLGRFGSPEDVAGLSIFLASPAGKFLTGTVIPLDGGIVGCGSSARF